MGNFFPQIFKKKHADRFSKRECKKLVENYSSVMGDAVDFSLAVDEDVWLKMEAPLHMLTPHNISGNMEKV